MRDSAIRNTHPTVVIINAETDAWDKDGNVVVLDESKIDAEVIRLQVEYDAKQYQRDRNYPDIGEQLDMLWHAIDNGEILGDKSCNFFKTLKKVKDDNPKPEQKKT